MAHKRVIAKLEVCGKFSDEYLKSVENNNFRTEDALQYYEKAKGNNTLSSFIYQYQHHHFLNRCIPF